MGTVQLTSGHHGLFIHNQNPDVSRRVELDPAWLKRPILYPSGAPMDAVQQKFTVAAFEALLEIPFDSAVSYGLSNINDPQLQHPHRVWGEITFEEPKIPIVAFSHDSRKANAPYRILSQWIEGLIDYPMPDEILEGVLGSWNKERWKAFFLEKVNVAAQRLDTNAATLREQALQMSDLANRIRLQLK